MSLDGVTGQIFGYVTKKELIEQPKQNFGEGYAYWIQLANLRPIEELANLI
jgi:hypothetical protein